MKKVLILISFCLMTKYGVTQSDSTVTQSDSTATETDPKPKASLTVGISYANNANYYGQKAEEKMPYVAAVAAFRLPSGFYLSGMAYKLLTDSGTVVSAAAAGAGFTFRMGEKFSADLGYSHTFFPANSSFLQAGNANNVNISLNHESWMTTTLQGDYAFGKTKDFFLTLGTGKMIPLFTFSETHFLALTPTVDVTAGTQRFYHTYLQEKKLRDSLLGLIDPIFGEPDEPAPTTSTQTKFDVLSYNLKLPLTYNFSSMMFEASYQLSVLGRNAESGSGNKNSFFNFSVYYQF